MILNERCHIKDISNHYNELDELYRKFWGNHLHHGLWSSRKLSKEEASHKLALYVLHKLGPIQNKNLIDVGCGYGTSARLACQKGAKEVIGYTVSQNQYKYAIDNKQKMNTTIHLQDWLNNDLRSSSLDGGYSIECFSHIKDKDLYFKEIARVLKPGSKFVMCSWLSCEQPSNSAQKLLLLPICKEGRLPSLYSQSEITSCMQKHGLVLEEFTDLSHLVWRTWWESLKSVGLGLFDKSTRNYFINKKNKEKTFVFSIIRILVAYKIGSFKYGLFVLKRAE